MKRRISRIMLLVMSVTFLFSGMGLGQTHVLAEEPGVLLCEEDFGHHPRLIHDWDGGTNFVIPWTSQGGANSTGYSITRETGTQPKLEYGNLTVKTGAFLTGGHSYTNIGRKISNENGVPDALQAYVNENRSFGVPGQSLYYSMLMRIDKNIGNDHYIKLHRAGTDWVGDGNGVVLGSLGSASKTGDDYFWTMQIHDGSVTTIKSDTKVVVGETAFLVLKMVYGEDGTTSYSLYVNPTLSDEGIATEPENPNASFSTAPDADMSWHSIKVYSGNSQAESSIDEIRIATGYGAVAPIGNIPEIIPPTPRPEYGIEVDVFSIDSQHENAHQIHDLGENYDQEILTKIGSNILANKIDNSTGKALDPDGKYYAQNFKTHLRIPEDGYYTFYWAVYTSSIEIAIGDQLLVSSVKRWESNSGEKTIYLTAGDHPLRFWNFAYDWDNNIMFRVKGDTSHDIIDIPENWYALDQKNLPGLMPDPLPTPVGTPTPVPIVEGEETDGVLLVYDSFNYPDRTILNSANNSDPQDPDGGLGWREAWTVQDAKEDDPRFVFSDSHPIKYPNLLSNDKYVTTVKAGQAGRRLKPEHEIFQGYAIDNNTLGLPDTTLWFSALLQIDGQENTSVGLHSNHIAWNLEAGEFNAPSIQAGSFGNNSVVDGKKYWTLRSNTNYVVSDVEIAEGEPALVVLRVDFDSVSLGARVQMFINPDVDNLPTTPDASYRIWGKPFKVQSVHFTLGDADNAKVDEIRLGTGFRSVVPYLNPPTPQPTQEPTPTPEPTQAPTPTAKPPVKPTVPPEDNLLVTLFGDVSFEEGTVGESAAGWGDSVLVDTESNYGDKSIVLKGPDTPGQAFTQKFSNQPLLPNSKYRMSCYMKVAPIESGTNVMFRLSYLVFGGNVDEITNNFTASDEWIKVEKEFVTPYKPMELYDDGTNYFSIAFWSATTAYIDDIALELIETYQAEPINIRSVAISNSEDGEYGSSANSYLGNDLYFKVETESKVDKLEAYFVELGYGETYTLDDPRVTVEGNQWIIQRPIHYAVGNNNIKFRTNADGLKSDYSDAITAITENYQPITSVFVGTEVDNPSGVSASVQREDDLYFKVVTEVPVDKLTMYFEELGYGEDYVEGDPGVVKTSPTEWIIHRPIVYFKGSLTIGYRAYYNGQKSELSQTVSVTTTN